MAFGYHKPLWAHRNLPGPIPKKINETFKNKAYKYNKYKTPPSRQSETIVRLFFDFSVKNQNWVRERESVCESEKKIEQCIRVRITVTATTHITNTKTILSDKHTVTARTEFAGTLVAALLVLIVGHVTSGTLMAMLVLPLLLPLGFLTSTRNLLLISTWHTFTLTPTLAFTKK